MWTLTHIIKGAFLLSNRALPKRANTLRKKSCCSTVTLALMSTSAKGSTTCLRVPSVSTQKQVTTSLLTCDQDDKCWHSLQLIPIKLWLGRISVPIDLKELDSFDPFAVPTIRLVIIVLAVCCSNVYIVLHLPEQMFVLPSVLSVTSLINQGQVKKMRSRRTWRRMRKTQRREERSEVKSEFQLYCGSSHNFDTSSKL